MVVGLGFDSLGWHYRPTCDLPTDNQRGNMNVPISEERVRLSVTLERVVFSEGVDEPETYYSFADVKNYDDPDLRELIPDDLYGAAFAEWRDDVLWGAGGIGWEGSFSDALEVVLAWPYDIWELEVEGAGQETYGDDPIVSDRFCLHVDCSDDALSEMGRLYEAM